MFQITETLRFVILAIIQGIAEFLPISSSGHLVVVDAILGNSNESAELNIVLHFGTLLAILVFYRQRIRELITQDRRVIPLLVVGTIPVGIIGLWVKKNHECILSNALLAGFMLPLTGFMLMLLATLKPGKKGYKDLSVVPVLLIGFAQAFAVLPGISRSGSTIVMGSLLGLKQQSAATFSFLLAIPAIGGASLVEAKEIFEEGAETPFWLLGLGAAISFGVGLLALRLLVRWIEKGRLQWFAYWLIPFGFAVVVWQLYEIAKTNLAT